MKRRRRQPQIWNPEAPMDSNHGDFPFSHLPDVDEIDRQNGHFRQVAFWIIAIFAIVVIVLLAVMAAFAHDSGSGWSYPTECCGGVHCKPVDCDSLSETKDGVRYLDLLFKAIYPSGDRHCHVCIESYDMQRRIPRCVFIHPGV